LAWIYDLKQQNVPEKDIPPFKNACLKLVKDMITWFARTNRRNSRQPDIPTEDIPIPVLLKLPGDKRQSCCNEECFTIDNKDTTRSGRKRARRAGKYCSECSDPISGRYVACCDVSKRNCWLLHVQEHHAPKVVDNVEETAWT
jgi:hypothetical protein